MIKQAKQNTQKPLKTIGMGSNIIEKLIDKGFDSSEIHNFCRDRDILTNISYTFAFTPKSEKEKHLQRIKDAEIEIDFTNFKK